MFTLPPDDRLRNENFRGLLGHPSLARLQSMRDVVGLMLLCYFAGFDDDRTRRPNPHVLLEGLNGTAKTTVVGMVVNVLLGEELSLFYELSGWDRYVRTAGSPDQTPAELVGFDQPGYDRTGTRQQLVFVPGPMLQNKMFHYNDEMNRSPPKTGSVWLEPMAEGGRVTFTSLDPDYRYRRTWQLTDFMMFASQNPPTQEGTFPLPEALADRFMVKLTMSYTHELDKLIRDGDARERAPDHAERRRSRVARLAALLGGPEFQRGMAKARGHGDLAEAVPADLADLGGAEAAARRAAAPVRDEADYQEVRRVEDLLLAVRRAAMRELKDQVRRVPFPDKVAWYASRLTYDTWSKKAYSQAVGGREEEVPIPIDPGLADVVRHVAAGASPRAAIALRGLSKSLAWAMNAPQVAEEHVEAVAQAVLRHRVLLQFQSAMDGMTPDTVVARLVEYRRRNRLRGGGQ